MDGFLNNLVTESEAGAQPPESHAAKAPLYHESSVAVTIYYVSGADAVPTWLGEYEVPVRHLGPDYIEAFVPIEALGPVSEVPGVLKVRVLHPPDATTSYDGSEVHNARPWNDGGYTGAGVKVGVLDLGFDGFSRWMGTELPATVKARCYHHYQLGTSRDLSDCEWKSNHGAAVSEAVIDIAPDVELYISNPQTAGDLSDAVDWIAQGVSVINMSVIWEWDGPGDGTSGFTNSPLHAVDRAVEAGIVWANAAGNYGEVAWMGDFIDSDGDRYMEFGPNDETNLVYLDGGEKFDIHVRWDDSWTASSTDVDLYLFDENGTQVADSSTHQQGLQGDTPREWFSYTALESGRYDLKVKLHPGAAPAWLQVMSWDSGAIFTEHHTGGSIANPAESANPGLLAVGATNWLAPMYIEPTSSRGPTPDGRIKPDIVAADAGNSSVTGTAFYGTSQASPHVAGLAALVRGRFPALTPKEVVNYLKTRAGPRGAVPNNTWGWGFAKLPPPNEDYDKDDDGLIEVSDLAQLNAIRWDLDGDGAPEDDRYFSAFLGADAGVGCPDTGCIGYELTRDLDMDTDGSGAFDAGDDYWNGGKGWSPIGDHPRDSFEATFHGNGHTISNLFISRPSTDYVGLFGATGYDSVVRNIGLDSPQVIGDQLTGALVGEKLGEVRDSYASRGSVTGTWWVGGLVGSNIAGSITTSYSTVDVTAHGGHVGGLAGVSGSRRSIVASYATGSVTAVGGIPEESRGIVVNGFGSLLGSNAGTVVASYGVGSVSGDADGNYIGGLSGNNAGTVTDSYWDTETTAQSTSSGGVGKSTSELQSPTGYEGIYEHWVVDTDGDSQTDEPWDFGTSSQYPALMVDFDGNGDATWHEFGDQRPLSGQSRTERAAPHVFATADKHNPLLGDTVIITALVGGHDDQEMTYDWQRLQNGRWRSVGPQSETKQVKFDSAGTKTYRALATLDSGHVQYSNASSHTWRHPCNEGADPSAFWSADIQAVAGRSEDDKTDDYRYTWYEYGWWDATDSLAETCGGLTDGANTYQLKHVSASISRMESKVYDEFTSVAVHISFDSRPPTELVEGEALVVGGTELAFADASTAQATDGEFYYSWYAALDYEPGWWVHFANSGQVGFSIISNE